MPVRKAIWNTDTQFNFGSPIKTGVNVVGTGENAYLALTARPDNNDNIDFSTSSDYTYDPSKIAVAGGKANLVPSGGTNDWNFSAPSDYTYDPSKVVVSGGAAKIYGSDVVPYAWWHLNELFGSAVVDSSGNSRNGVTVNIPLWVVGKLNNCLQFNGSTQSVDFGDVASFERTQSFSIEFWVSTTTTTGSPQIVGKVNNTTYIGYEVFLGAILGAYYINFALLNMLSNYLHVRVLCSTLFDGNFHHVVITYNGSSTSAGVKIYFDNVLKTNDTVKDNLAGTIITTETLKIAKDNTGSFFNGKLDEIAIYDKVLSAAEVSFRYNSGSGIETMPGNYLITNPPINPTVGAAFTSAIGTFTETSIKPAGTEIKYHVSSDGGITWKYWTGSAWAVTDNTYTQANEASIVNTNIGMLAISGTFNFRALLNSTSGVVTPTLDNIQTVTGITYPVGSFEIAYNIDIAPTYIVVWLTFVESVVKPTNTDALYKYSVDSGANWNASWLTAVAIQTALQAISTPTKVRIKVQLTTSSSLVTPEISNILITSSAGNYVSGSYESIAYLPDTNPLGLYLEKIDFGIEVPSGTTCVIQVKPVNQTLEEGYITYDNGDLIGYSGNLIQWKALLNGNGLSTPKVNFVEISFSNVMDLLHTGNVATEAIPVTPLIVFQLN